MSGLVAARFYGEPVLNSCLSGHRIFSGSGDPPETVAIIQQALKDLGFEVEVDGSFGSQTGRAVIAYKTGKRLMPNDPVIGKGTITALDRDFEHELFDFKAAMLTDTRFDIGTRIVPRADLAESYAICVYQNGVCVELVHQIAYAIPARAMAAWTLAGGIDGAFGAPASDPFELNTERSAQEFDQGALVFGGESTDFFIPRPMWEASVAGAGMIGNPIGPTQSFGEGGATLVPHEFGGVLLTPGVSPQPLPQAVLDLWKQQEVAGTSLGSPSAFAFPSDAGLVFPFRLGSITLSESGVASLSGLFNDSLQRYFQPEDNTQSLMSPMVGTVAKSLIGGDVMLRSLRDDIAKANSINDFVYILSWHFDIDMELVVGDANSTLRKTLTDCVAAGVQVRAMLWAGDPIPSPPLKARIPLGNIVLPWDLTKVYARRKTSRTVNEPAKNFINSLASGAGSDAAAILDDQHLFAGSHHQKVVVIKAGSKLVAYVGGIEPNVDRLKSVPNEPGSPLFDASVRLEDAGAWLVLRAFILRWDLHRSKFGAPLRGASMPVPAPNGPLTVQITSTYGQGFPFANAVRTASTALSNGIKNASQFFYIEDQYCVGSPKMTDAIRDALSSKPDLIGIINIAAELSVSDLPDLPFRRRAFLAPLVNAFPGRLLVFERLGNGSSIGPGAYVHTKLLIVDDEAAFIGSVNSNRRSWFHDSEIDVTIVDNRGPGETAPGTRGWVREFRSEMWAKHFNLPANKLGEFTTCLDIWRAIASGQLVLLDGNLFDISSTVSVRPYNVNAAVQRFSVSGVPLPHSVLEAAWNAILDPT